METKNFSTKKILQRRHFLKISGLSLLSLPFLTKAKLAFGGLPPDPREYWEGPEDAKYCVQRTVRNKNAELGIIWARIDGIWRKFQIKELEQNFWDWNFSERIARYENQKAGGGITAAGPHTPSVATYGNRMGRGDSDFHVNNKLIGITIVPKEEYIKEINNTMLEKLKIPFQEKLDYLIEITSNRDLWCKDKQAGIEIFSTPEFMTHTFYNLMKNPVATLCFQGAIDIFTSFEVRCIAKIVHPLDPEISDQEKDIALFPNILHGFFHGMEPEPVPGVIYYHIEEYNNAPSAQPGIRVVSITKQGMKRLFA